MTTVDLRQFRYLIAVAEERHFGRAAAQLHIAQSGLSQQILKLERSVGVQLLVRDRRGVEITDAGRSFLDYARLTVELADRAVTSARLADGGKKGPLRVGTPVLGLPPLAGPVLQEFEDRFPEVKVEFYPHLHPDLIDRVSTYELDVALVLSPFKSVDPPPRYQQLGTFELMAAVPEGHRLAEFERLPPPELLTEPFLDWPRSVNPELIDHIHRLLFGKVEHPQALEVAEMEEARRLDLVADGTGIAILVGVVERPTPGVVFRGFDDPAALIGYGVAWSAIQASPFVEEFLMVAREVAATEAPSSTA